MSSSLHISTSTTQSRPKGALPSSPVVASAYKTAKMSITQTYFLAHKARGKLSHEAARPDHNLRLLVGHANLLDSLMLELADAEREQESWFNQSVRGASKSEERHIQWADSIVEEPEQDWQAEDADLYSDSDSDSDSDLDEDEDIEMADMVSLRRIPSNNKIYYDEDMEEDDDEEEDYAHLALSRSPSHSASPPELDHDSDSSEDESMPPSPPTAVLPTFSEKEHKETITTTNAFYEQGYYLPPRNPARLVSAISVY
ncbi:hypothetical protein V8F20_010468 [Naviculisporaceae sp. PSN 640]